MYQGDSGGPLTYKQGDQHIMIGVVSYGFGVDVGPDINSPISGPKPPTAPGGGQPPKRKPQKKKCGEDNYYCRVAEMRSFIDFTLQNAKFCSDFEAQDNEDNTYY